MESNIIHPMTKDETNDYVTKVMSSLLRLLAYSSKTNNAYAQLTLHEIIGKIEQHPYPVDLKTCNSYDQSSMQQLLLANIIIDTEKAVEEQCCDIDTLLARCVTDGIVIPAKPLDLKLYSQQFVEDFHMSMISDTPKVKASIEDNLGGDQVIVHDLLFRHPDLRGMRLMTAPAPTMIAIAPAAPPAPNGNQMPRAPRHDIWLERAAGPKDDEVD